MSKRSTPLIWKILAVATTTFLAVSSLLANWAQIGSTFPKLYLLIPAHYRQVLTGQNSEEEQTLTNQEVEEYLKKHPEAELITETSIGEHTPYYVGAVDSVNMYREPNIGSEIVDGLEEIKDKNFIHINESVADYTSNSSNIIKTLKKDFTYDETKTITVTPAVIAARRKLSLDATDYGPIRYFSRDYYYNSTIDNRKKIDLKVGEEIEVMRYVAEGSYLLRHKGRIIGAQVHVSDESDADFGIVNGPIKCELWIRLVDIADSHRPMGWVLVEDNSSGATNLITKNPYMPERLPIC